MMTVHEVSRHTGVSIRTLQYYDKIGLLPPAATTPAGYRLYDRAALEKLQQILFFRELEFSLKEIREIVNRPDFDRDKALRQQIELLTLKREHIDALIRLARDSLTKEEETVAFQAFDKTKLEEYATQAKARWGDTAAWREYEQRSADRTEAQEQDLGTALMDLFADFGAIRDTDPAAPAAQALVRQLQAFISDHYYTCTKEILSGLGQMYAAGGAFTENIDRRGGDGTAAFAAAAIAHYCR